MRAYAKGNGSLETQVGNPAPGKDWQRREEGQQGLRAKRFPGGGYSSKGGRFCLVPVEDKRILHPSPFLHLQN